MSVIPIRQNIEILPADEEPSAHDHLVITSKKKLRKGRFRIGFKVSEKIGIAIVNPRGVKSGSKSTLIK